MPLQPEDLLAYLRLPDGAVDLWSLAQIADLANGVVEEVTGVLDPEPVRVQAIRLEVAARPIRNPEGHTSETIDSYTWRGELSRAGVYLTAEERQELLDIASGAPASGPWAGSLAYPRPW